MSSSDFQQTIIGEATRQAVDEVTRQLVSQSEKVQGTKIEVNGVVADVTENVSGTQCGQNQGLNVGDVWPSSGSRKSSRTGHRPGAPTLTEAIGTAKINSVDDRSSVADFSGVGRPQVGDAVKRKE